jgi:hypothetical protein
MLEVDTEDKSLIEEPDGYITVMWHKVDMLQMPQGDIDARRTVGWLALIAITLMFWWLAHRAAPMQEKKA